MINAAQSPSRSGYCSTSASSSATTSAAGAQLDPRCHRVLDQAQPHLLEPRTVRVRPVARVDEDLAPEQGQTLARTLQDYRGVARAARDGDLCRELCRLRRVDRCRGYGEHVAVAAADDEVLVAESAT